MPKFNMYQSLHTTVIGPGGKPVELQIRTYGMHRRAEYGVAAHWKYKEDSNNGVDTDRTLASGDSASADMAWVRQLMDWQKETQDPSEFLDSLRFEISSAEVYVFTPRGEVDLAADRVDPGRLRLRHPYRGRPPMHRGPGQRPAGRARVGARQRRRGRGLHLEVAERRSEPRLADVRQEPPGPQQDQAVLHQGASRGGDRAGQGEPGPADAPRGPAAAAHAHPRHALGGRLRPQPPRRHRALRRGGGGQHVGAVRRTADPRDVRRRPGGGRRGRRDGRRHDRQPGAAPAGPRRLRRHREGRVRRPHQAGAVLHPGAGRRDRRAS